MQDEPARMPTCEWCGKPTRMYQGRPQRFCSRVGDETNSACSRAFLSHNRYRNKTPEERAAKYHDDYRRRRENTDRHERYLAYRKRHYLENRDRLILESTIYKRRVAALRRGKTGNIGLRADNPLAGSVLAASAEGAPGRDILAELHAAVSIRLPHDTRMEIICEAALLVLEGEDVRVAAKTAAKSVNKNAAFLHWSTRPIEDCYWL